MSFLSGEAPARALGLAATLSLAVACGGSQSPAAAGGSPNGGAAAVAGDGSTIEVGGSGGTGSGDPAVVPPNPCRTTGGCPAGKWINVTPATVDLVKGECGNFGTKTVQVDRQHPNELYTIFFCQGIWKSTDYGETWKGPINTGENGATIGDCAGGISVPPGNTATPPILYVSCIRGNGLGFWRSTNGGVDWTKITIVPAAPNNEAAQQFYPAQIDPYDPNHILLAGHAVNLLVESTDGGLTFKPITVDPKMTQKGGTTGISFVNTGKAVTTRGTWLFLASQTGGFIGTWRTADGGATWKQVEKNEHVNGASQIYQPDATSGVLYMAGTYSDLGWGVLRSPDYGVTWTHVGKNTPETIVFGTPKNVYAMYGWAIGAGQTVDSNLEVGPDPGTGEWASPGAPPEMTQGPAQAAVTNDGKNSIILVANYSAGMWRYIEP